MPSSGPSPLPRSGLTPCDEIGSKRRPPKAGGPIKEGEGPVHQQADTVILTSTVSLYKTPPLIKKAAR